MKHLIIFTVLLFAVQSYSASRASDTLGQDSPTYRQNMREFKFEIIRELNELMLTDMDSLFSFTTGLNALSIDIDTVKGVQFFVLDASVGSNSGLADYYNILKTSVVTIGHPGETSTDWAFTSAANATEQAIGADSIPAYARIVDVMIITTQAVVGITTAFAIELGNADSDDRWGTSTDLKAVNALIGGDTKEAILDMPSASVVVIHVSADPDAENWSAMSAGEFTLITTYYDYGAIK